MNWNQLNTAEQIETIKEESKNQRVLIFKHSTRCGVSAASLDRLERAWSEEEMRPIKPYFLDLIRYRSISNLVAEAFGVMHQSPQVIVIEKGEAIFDTSHFNINYQDLKGLAIA